MLLTEQQIEARRCLAVGSYLVDPRYFPEHMGMEAKLKDRCRECWALREHWPQWVKDYAARWAAEKAQT